MIEIKYPVWHVTYEHRRTMARVTFERLQGDFTEATRDAAYSLSEPDQWDMVKAELVPFSEMIKPRAERLADLQKDIAALLASDEA